MTISVVIPKTSNNCNMYGSFVVVMSAMKERFIQTDRQTDRQTGRQAGRQTDRQTDRPELNYILGPDLCSTHNREFSGESCCLPRHNEGRQTDGQTENPKP